MLNTVKPVLRGHLWVINVEWSKKPVLRGHLWLIVVEYSQTCIKRSPLVNCCWIQSDLYSEDIFGTKKKFFFKTGDLLKEVPSYDIFYDKTRKKWPLHTGDCLIVVIVWADLTLWCTVLFELFVWHIFFYIFASLTK